MSPILPVGDPCKCHISQRPDRELVDHGTDALRRAHWGEFMGDHYAPPDDAARDTILAALAADCAQPPETT